MNIKVADLQKTLECVNADDIVEFIVKKDGAAYIANPLHATASCEYEIPKRGELDVLTDPLPQTLSIYLEI